MRLFGCVVFCSLEDPPKNRLWSLRLSFKPDPKKVTTKKETDPFGPPEWWSSNLYVWQQTGGWLVQGGQLMISA